MLVINQLCEFYDKFDQASLASLGDIYADDIVFADPIHQLEGLSSLTDYFGNFCSPSARCGFEILTQVIDTDERKAFLRWRMHYSHPKLAGNKPLELFGGSYLEFADKVTRQEDFYDLGAMLYEHIPVLGWAVKTVKKRLDSNHT